MANTLFLCIEGPLQSWGERGRWSIRDSAPVPTKSGIIGLIACVLGYKADGPIRTLSAETRMGVRIDNPGVRLTDYHTIGGGYVEPMLLTAQGKPKISSGRPHTEISHRDYLCNAAFLVALQGSPETVAQMAAAVQEPAWVFFLGRKSCPPSRPVFDGVGTYPDLSAALSQHHWPENVQQLPAVLETIPQAENAVRRRDHLVSRLHRTFHPRYTQTVTLRPEINQEESVL